MIRKWKLKNFAEGIKFLNNVAIIAEEEGHHPNISLKNFNEVKITLYTHAVGNNLI